MCEKAFGCCCFCQQKDYDISHKEPMSSKANHVQTKRQKPEVAAENTKVAAKTGREEGQTQAHVKNNAVKMSSLSQNNSFSDYINRVKVKLRTTSHVGGEKSASSKHDVHDSNKDDDNTTDKFSDYINRAKMKIRKTSTIGNRKNDHYDLKRE